ncbi:2-phosphosulfolactate phosphatase [Deinococcus peraridilitoris]|uniref:Probable 2-phosphosulfolactate phosphatase n=1 Tax=Deinococcus peraridilitoris (strain DSM 19664 / LMG 22246 / CIP 109416 / KR-200) TaxID=937777 RepID=L0A7B3_DEIPD|nr:2-phosphosulfolactate phosphatase [Deinococcus peraridilitoris]AFZ69072.1 phosphosulfolactate phosphohydrolase-like enzyme [Deinococcus peraridilitoris DSM 19664]
MRLRVDLLPGREYPDVVILVDVLRATTAAPIVLEKTGLFVTPSLRAARAFGSARSLLVAGERDGLPPEGFNYSASPDDLRRARFERDVVLTTENGPRALAQVVGARHVLLGSFYNARAVTEVALRLATEEISLVCAGMRGEEAIEDIVCAGFLSRRIEKLAPVEVRERVRLSQALLRAYADPLEALAQSASGALLMKLGLFEDLAVASLISHSSAVPRLASTEEHEGHPVYAFEDANRAPAVGAP